MSGLLGQDLAGVVGTWLAAAVTLGVWAYLAGERRLFAWAQHLLAGLMTGYLVVLAVDEVLGPRLIAPLAADPVERVDLWIGALLAGTLVVARYLPRVVAGPPVALLIAGIAAFALGGAVVGTLLPQTAAGMLPGPDDVGNLAIGLAGLMITVVVLLYFLHGVPRTGLIGATAHAGHWVTVVGLGAWFGFILLSGLVLLADRIDFLLFEWLGVGT